MQQEQQQRRSDSSNDNLFSPAFHSTSVSIFPPDFDPAFAPLPMQAPVATLPFPQHFGSSAAFHIPEQQSEEFAPWEQGQESPSSSQSRESFSPYPQLQQADQQAALQSVSPAPSSASSASSVPPAESSSFAFSASTDGNEWQSASPSSSAAPSRAAVPAPKRQRRSALSAAERAAIKKLKHREIDAQRRQRESAAIARLQQLMSSKSGGTTVEVEVASSASGERDEEGEGEEERKDKVSVLEDSARRMQQLQELVDRLSDTCSNQAADIQKLTLHLHDVGSSGRRGGRLLDDGELDAAVPPLSNCDDWSDSVVSLLPASTARSLMHADRQHALYTSTFLSASICLFVVSVSTGAILEANSLLYESTGWRPPHIINRVLTVPWDVLMSSQPAHPGRHREVDSQRVLVDSPDGDGRLVPARAQPQYGRSKEQMQALYSGRTSNISAVWRTQLKNGGIYEVRSSTWVGSRERVPDGRGGFTQRPLHVVMATSLDEAIRLE